MRGFSRLLVVGAFLGALSAGVARSENPLPAGVLSWGDQGDGTFRNPVLKADYSDPDVIRVGQDFYLAASEFHFVGIQILHSRDLVNWRIAGQVFDRLPMAGRYDEMGGYAQGTWAPSLRYHDGVFYLYACTPEEGLFMWHTRDPAGPWSDAVTVKTVSGWEDPCPFWDDDGRAYLVHGKVGAGPIFLHTLSADGARLLDDGVEIYRGPVAEGPKIYRRNGWYFISLPEGGVGGGGQTVLRAKNIFGPYERREVLPAGSPHQGGMVELANGDWWFMAFKSADFLGRIVHLMPVTWGADDWPVFGDGGRAVEQWKKPETGAGVTAPSRPDAGDEFDGPALGAQWQWNHNPTEHAASLSARKGWLRLRGEPAAELKRARNTVTQKLWDDAGVVDVKLEASGLSEGQRAGFAFQCGDVFHWVGVTRRQGVLRIRFEGEVGPPLAEAAVWLRGVYDGDRARLLYSLDGASFVDTGMAVQLRAGQWKGARAALFCYGEGGGSIDVDYFRYRYSAGLAELALDRNVAIGEGVNGAWCEPVGTWDGRVVLLYQGSGHVMDGPGGLVKRLAHELAAKGIASLRLNPRGEGGPMRAQPEPTLGARLADAEAAWAFATKQPGVDARRLGVLGWSQGGTIAIETGARHPAWFRSMAVWSSPSGDQEKAMLEDQLTPRVGPFDESVRGVDLDRSLARYPGAFFSLRGAKDFLPAHEMEFMAICSKRTEMPVAAEALTIGGADHLFNVGTPDARASVRAVEVTVAWFLRTL
jgi:beta-xylosidase/dienelactone hydrolase